MRLIDADDLIFYGMTDDISQAQAEDIVANAPTIEAEPVRRGRWLEGKCFECSECKARAAFAVLSKGDGKDGRVALELLSNYCPNCGAKMEEVI